MDEILKSEYLEDEEDVELYIKILRKFLPKFVVDYDLFDLYVKDENFVMKRLMEIMDEQREEINSLECIMVDDFMDSLNGLITFINKTDDLDFNEHSRMFLFYAVSLFENMIDCVLQTELEFKDLSIKKANEFLSKLSIEDKLDYLLKLLTNKTFIDRYEWSIIKPFIKARNFFIHYKPQDFAKYKQFKTYLEKGQILKFLSNSIEFYNYIMSNRSEEIIGYENKIECITKLFEERLLARAQISSLNQYVKKFTEQIDN